MNFDSNKYEKIYYLKTTWIKNITEAGGAMKYVIDNASDDEVVIHSHTYNKGRLWASVAPEQLLKLIEKNRGIYEVITRYPHRVYFDIDKPGKHKNLLVDIKKKLSKMFRNSDLAISGSITDKKTSYHIVLPNYLIYNDSDRIKLKNICRELGEEFDASVYSRNRHMKCINQSKTDGRVQRIVEDVDETNHMITCFIKPHFCYKIKYKLNFDAEMKMAKENGLNMGDLPKMKLILPDNFTVGGSTMEELLNMAPINSDFNHAYTYKVACFANKNGIDFNSYWEWCRKKNDSLDRKKKWERHWNMITEGSYIVHLDQYIRILKEFYPHILRDVRFNMFKKMIEIVQDEKIKRIVQKHYKINKKYILMNIGMGHGKTITSIKLIKEKNFLWITPRRSLANDTYSKMKVLGVKNVLNYLHLPSTVEKEYEIPRAKKLILQTESLHYLGKKEFDYVILDEMETILNNWTSSQTHGTHMRQNWNIFNYILRNSKKVIILDAFMTNKTINHLNRIDPKAKKHIYYTDTKKVRRTVKMLPVKGTIKQTYYAWINMIIEDLNQDKKLYVFYPYSAQNKSTQYATILGLKKQIESKTKKKILVYHGSMAQKKKNKLLEDVNKTWSEYDMILSNSCITVGVGYDEIYFHKVYIALIPWICPRDVIQATYRVRNLKENKIIATVLNGMTNDIFIDREDMGEEYVELVKDINVERISPLVETFKALCEKANYEFTDITNDVSDDVVDEYRAFFKKYDVHYKYDNIENISKQRYKMIEHAFFIGNADLYDQMQITKYLFKKMYVDDTPEEILKQIWDGKDVVFHKKLYEYKLNGNSKIAKLLDDLDINICELDSLCLRKFTMSKENKNKIKNFVLSKFEYSRSSDVKMLSLLLNTYFEMKILEYVPLKPKSRNKKWIVTEHYKNSVELAKKYLNIPERICDKLSMVMSE